ncbi:MAG TPA: hypothetical protein PK843_06385 [bacterium]|nr:hypothetical protein [bacterium]HPN34120.1 hypothetical protein [bacterium]
MNPAILCGWNQEPFAERLADEPGFIVCCDQDNFFARLLEDSVQAVILAAELTWSGEAPSVFYGFEVLCRMRAETGLGCAVVMASFMEGEWLRRRFPILDFQSHHPLVRLPARPQVLRQAAMNAKPADRFRLRDMVRSYCDPRGRLLRLLTHGNGFRKLAALQVPLSPSDQQALMQDARLLERWLEHLPADAEHIAQLKNLLDRIDKIGRTPTVENISDARRMLQEICRSRRPESRSESHGKNDNGL